MKWFKKSMVVIGYSVLAVLVFCVLYLSADFLLSRIPATRSPMGVPEHGVQVYLLSNGVHTDLVLPVRHQQMDWHTVFSPDHSRKPDSTLRWIAIGWGDKGFYLNTPEWKDLTLKTALIAGFGIGETALHVTYYKALREDDHCRSIQISEAQYLKLQEYIMNSVEKDGAGKAQLISTEAQYGDHDAFYEAEGAYSLFFSCNTWTNNALKYANMPAGIWTVFDKGILRHYK